MQPIYLNKSAYLFGYWCWGNIWVSMYDPDFADWHDLIESAIISAE